jgi:hypothetical protein
MKKEITSFDTSRRKKQHSTAWPHCLVDQHKTAQPSMLLAALGPQMNQLCQQVHQCQATSQQTHCNHGIAAATFNTILYDF